MGNKFSFESDSDVVKLVLKIDNTYPNQLFTDIQALPLFKSKQLLSNGDVLILFEDQFQQFLQRDVSCFKHIKDSIYAIEKRVIPSIETEAQGIVQLNVSGYRTGVHNEQLMDHIRKIFNDEKVEVQTKRIVKSLLVGLDYFMGLKKPFYHFQQTIPLTSLDKFSKDTDLSKDFVDPHTKGYPFIFVKIRSGVSFYKITGPREFQRLSGSIMGESFLESMMLKLTNYKNINDGFKDGFANGSHKMCDMTVEDIYGSGCEHLGIPKDILASSFGKCSKRGPISQYKDADIMKSLLIAFTINTGQLTTLYSRLENITNILISSWKIQCDEFNFALQSTMAYYSKNLNQIDFIEDSDYLSCVGDLM